MDNNIYNKLTDSAKTALEETTREFTEMIIDKAFQNANKKNTADKEISLTDIIEAKEEILYKRSELYKQESKKRRMTLMLSMTGALYSIFGILFYLYQNKSFDSTKDMGLIIAALGILISILAFYYSQLITRQKVELLKNNKVIERDNSEFEIVRRWQMIEKLGTKLMLRDGISDDRAKSFNFIIKYLSDRLFDNSKTDELRKLLLARNQVVHGGSSMTKVEIEEMIRTADQIIDELEKRITKH